MFLQESVLSIKKMHFSKTKIYYSLNPSAYVLCEDNVLTDFQQCISVFKVKSVIIKNYKNMANPYHVFNFDHRSNSQNQSIEN